jgi:hypothetical protein
MALKAVPTKAELPTVRAPEIVAERQLIAEAATEIAPAVVVRPLLRVVSMHDKLLVSLREMPSK